MIAKELWAFPGTWYPLSGTQIMDFLPAPGCSVTGDLSPSFGDRIWQPRVVLQCGFTEQIARQTALLEGE